MIVKVHISNPNYLISQGLISVFAECEGVRVTGTTYDVSELKRAIPLESPDVVLLDYSHEGLCAADVVSVMKQFPSLKVVAITTNFQLAAARQLVQAGIAGHLMSDCDRDEIIDCVMSVIKGDRFFCGKVLDRLNEAEGSLSNHGCDGVLISDRELEVLQLIAQGLTTKQIAEKLFLSHHTVMTHRKNMMNKLGLSNTAGLIIYAVRENLISPNKFLFSEKNG
ncbi:MAG: response regulator transcription factor [Salibacteraceae bacterium]